MPVEPPTYGSREYWDHRFTKDTQPFEWLSAPDKLDPYITDALQSTCDQDPKILHIGCGSSLLSYHLRAHVNHPKQIHNVDYSSVVVDLGKQREIDLFTNWSPEENTTTNITATTSEFTCWDSIDLLDLPSLLNACNPLTYSLIIDKSTSDCIACADDVEIMQPYPLGWDSPNSSPSSGSSSSPSSNSNPGSQSTTTATTKTSHIYPLYLIAAHLALLAKPGARWIALSYSAERFYFLDNDDAGAIGHQEQEQSVLPDVRKLWRVRGKYEIEAVGEQQQTTVGRREGDRGTVVHTPKVMHWVYVLERTDVGVCVRS